MKSKKERHNRFIENVTQKKGEDKLVKRKLIGRNKKTAYREEKQYPE